jgi:hypothetical protein
MQHQRRRQAAHASAYDDDFHAANTRDTPVEKLANVIALGKFPGNPEFATG